MSLSFLKSFFLPVLVSAYMLCSSFLFTPEVYKFSSGDLEGRRMAYSLQTPLNWNGKTLVFVPGFSRNMHFWDKHANEYFNKGFRIFRYDPFNIGQSLSLNGVLSQKEHGFNFHDDIKALTQILKNLGISNEIILIGHSLGSAKAIFLERALNKSRGDIPVKKVLIASPFVRFLSDYYDEQNAENIASPFLIPNIFKGILPLVGDQVDLLNEGIKGLSEGFVSAGSYFFSPYAINESIEQALDEREANEETGLERSLEEAALLEIMNSLEEISVLEAISKVRARIHLLTGDNDKLIVPLDLLEELKDAAPKSMTHTLIESDHFTPSKKDYYTWLNRFLR